MRIIYTLLLAFILTIVFIFNYKKNKDLFCPLCFFTVMIFIRYIPNMFEKEYEHFASLNSSNIFLLFRNELIALFSVIIGYYFGNRITIMSKYKTNSEDEISTDCRIKQWHIIVLFAIGMFARLRAIIISGGINFIRSNAAVAYLSLSNGTGALSMLSGFAIVAVMMQLALTINYRKTEYTFEYKKNRFILIVMILLYSFTFLIFTSRSPIFELLLFVLFGVNYLWKKLKVKDFLTPKVLVLIILSMIAIVMLPLIRQGKSISIKSLGSVTSNVFDEFSYVGRDTFIYENFNQSNYWNGSNYKSLITAFVPYRLYKQKPPNDDGVYLANIMYGYWVDPPVPRDNLVVSYSIPFSTPGILYANFGLLGIFFGNIILGMIYSSVYKKLKNNPNVLSVIIYQLVVYQLELSTLSIIQTLLPLIIAYFAYRPATAIQIKIKNESKIL